VEARAVHIGVESFYDPATHTISHVVVEPNGRACAIVDAVLDYDAASGRTRTESADRIVAHVRERGLEVQWILETHAHADHLSAARYLKRQLGGRIAIGARITEVQRIFREVFNLERTFNTDGRQFDHLFEDGEIFHIGRLEARVMYTPGHTPACCTYVVGDVAFVGDTLFMPDGGTARADFPGGDARTLYRSIMKILSLPPDTRLHMCHDYQPGGREPRWVTTVAEEREHNIHVGGGRSEEEFVRLRTERDRTLGTPQLLIPSIQVNIRAGDLPPPEDNGVRYLKVPLNRL
jgi:glyoxylase-like metal-dependent hydrolase (beta-lactamase superfamily II)